MTNLGDLEHTVRYFRQILLWPLQLLPMAEEDGRRHWQVLEETQERSVWQRVVNEFADASRVSQEQYYKEFVVFLPYVRRFLYGESRGPWIHDEKDPAGESALKVFRRRDVAALRLVLRTGTAPILLSVDGVELIFFDDIDLVFLKVEISATDLLLTTVREMLYRFGRAYPTSWNEAGQGIHNVLSAEWLGTGGQALAASDSDNRMKFLAFSCQHRAPCTSAHWSFLLQPLVPAPAVEKGLIRFHQVEYHRIPMMAYLAVDDPRSITRDTWLRLGMIASLHPDEPIPRNDPDVFGFESHYCYDRYWTDTEAGPNSRFLCSGRVLLVVGDARESYFINAYRGMLAKFRHQYFIVFLIAHLHRASLLIFSDRLVDAIHDLDIRQGNSVRTFRHRIHLSFETFLRFTHRYWFHKISERDDIQSLLGLCGKWLGNDSLYEEVKEELWDMSQYLDSDMQRRQSKTVVQLTVVTAFSLIGTIATGILGMNIIDETGAPFWVRWGYFFLTVVVSATIMLLTVTKSRWLWDMMEIISDNRLSMRARLRQIFQTKENPGKTH
ncbi:MAG: hypothetical protein HQL57_06340 [Magnetococcales bacterium]|nr:hypothetical protein [Magnetococcales bacterium]MBF0156788.1 hypothetical protein [Magnetococcales bacterium]